MKEIIKKMIVDSIASWTDTDIYAVSLYVENINDDPCRPTVQLSYNTETQVQARLSEASDEGEVRWNYAYWLQNSFFIFGDGETQDVVKKWITESGYPIIANDDPAWDEDFDLTYDKVAGIETDFVAVLIDIVREIHDEKLLTEKFGRELPILIHELEYYEEIAQQNFYANGPEIAGDFIDWVMCGQ